MSLLEDNKLTLKTEDVDLGALLERIKVSFERIKKDRAVTWTNVGAFHIETDPDRVEQILINLLQNAAKYSPQGTAIVLSLSHDESGTRITVTDHGNGIRHEDFEYIFDPYARLAKDRDRTEGLGLGLYICRTLAHALGGTLTLKSTVGQGSTFILTLPLVTAATKPTAH